MAKKTKVAPELPNIGQTYYHKSNPTGPRVKIIGIVAKDDSATMITSIVQPWVIDGNSFPPVKEMTHTLKTFWRLFQVNEKR